MQGPIEFTTYSDQLFARQKFNVVLSNNSSSALSIIDWRLWEEFPTKAAPRAGGVYVGAYPELIEDTKPATLPIYLEAGRSKAFTLKLGLRVPPEVELEIKTRVVLRKPYSWSETNDLLKDSDFQELGQLKLRKIEVVERDNSGLPAGSQVLRYGLSEYYQCFAIKFTLGDDREIAARFSFNTSNNPQALILSKEAPRQECIKERSPSALLQKS